MQNYDKFFYFKNVEKPEFIKSYAKKKANKKIKFFRKVEKNISVKKYNKNKSKNYTFFTHSGSVFWNGYSINTKTIHYQNVIDPVIEPLKKIFYSSLKKVKKKVREEQKKKDKK